MTGRNRPPRPYKEYKPQGGIPWPTLADGTPYRLQMAVRLVRERPGPDGEEYEFTYRGSLQWVEWTDDTGRWAPPDGGTDKRAEGKERPEAVAGRWRAVVDWGPNLHEGDRPLGRVWVDELEADE